MCLIDSPLWYSFVACMKSFRVSDSVSALAVPEDDMKSITAFKSIETIDNASRMCLCVGRSGSWFRRSYCILPVVGVAVQSRNADKRFLSWKNMSLKFYVIGCF